MSEREIPFPTITEAEWLLPRAKAEAARLGLREDETPLAAGYWDHRPLEEWEQAHARELAVKLGFLGPEGPADG